MHLVVGYMFDLRYIMLNIRITKMFVEVNVKNCLFFSLNCETKQNVTLFIQLDNGRIEQQNLNNTK